MKKMFSLIAAALAGNAAMAVPNMAIAPKAPKPWTLTKRDAKQQMEIAAHNAAIDEKKAAKRAIKERRRALDAAMRRYGGRA